MPTDVARPTDRTGDDVAGGTLDHRELAVLNALMTNRSRVLSRSELTRLSGLNGLNERRCDSLLVGIRRVLGADAIRTVRGRGWIIDSEFA
jgi:DNA-binding response OmpR family regulator